MFENVKVDLVTKLLLGTLIFLLAKTFELITLAGYSTLVVPDEDFFLNKKALKSKHITQMKLWKPYVTLKGKDVICMRHQTGH